jgi:hypothetical protein
MTLLPGKVYRILAPHAVVGIFRLRLPYAQGVGFQYLHQGKDIVKLVHEPLFRRKSAVSVVDGVVVGEVSDGMVGEELVEYLREKTEEMIGEVEE